MNIGKILKVIWNIVISIIGICAGLYFLYIFLFGLGLNNYYAASKQQITFFNEGRYGYLTLLSPFGYAAKEVFKPERKYICSPSEKYDKNVVEIRFVDNFQNEKEIKKIILQRLNFNKKDLHAELFSNNERKFEFSVNGKKYVNLYKTGSNIITLATLIDGTQSEEKKIRDWLDHSKYVVMPKFKKNTDLLKKTPLFYNPGLGEIGDIKNIGNNVLVITGGNGFVFWDGQKIIKEHLFPVKERKLHKVLIINTGLNLQPNFLVRDVNTAAIINTEGKTIWRHMWGQIDSVAVGDVDKDGKDEVALGSMGGLLLLDCNGNKIWKTEGTGSNLYGLEIADINKDGNNEIIYSDSYVNLYIRDKRGKMLENLSEEKNGLKYSKELVNWFDSREKTVSIGAFKKEVSAYTYRGKLLTKFKIPQEPEFVTGRFGAIINTPKGGKLFALVIKGNSAPDVLYVFDKNSNIVYNDVIPNKCNAIYSYDSKLLICGENRVFNYSFR